MLKSFPTLAGSCDFVASLLRIDELDIVNAQEITIDVDIRMVRKDKFYLTFSASGLEGVLVEIFVCCT